MSGDGGYQTTKDKNAVNTMSGAKQITALLLEAYRILRAQDYRSKPLIEFPAISTPSACILKISAHFFKKNALRTVRCGELYQRL